VDAEGTARLGDKPPMNEQMQNPFDVLLDQIRQIVREEIGAALQNSNGHVREKEGLLTPEEAAEILGQNVRWLYRHANKLPFSRRINRKTLRFQESGLHRWIAAKKPDSRR
jgi:predicted DNA-binding transcriptional regulator AlpA